MTSRPVSGVGRGTDRTDTWLRARDVVTGPNGTLCAYAFGFGIGCASEPITCEAVEANDRVPAVQADLRVMDHADCALVVDRPSRRRHGLGAAQTSAAGSGQ